MRHRPARQGFTLVELLIVMAIIAILAGLLLAGVQRVQIVADRTKAANDVTQLASSCAEFKREFGFYPPEIITIPAAGTAPAATSPLKRMFPNGDFTAAGSTYGDYAGKTLNPSETLVLFLGGLSQAGWDSKNPAIPLTLASTTTKKGPYFVFEENRLDRTTGTNGVPQFIDPWGTPYIYFRSLSGNDYTGSFPTTTSPTGKVDPYQESASRFANQQTVQIISAGRDKKFGPGGSWTPGVSPYTDGDVGADDLANFNQGAELGVYVGNN